jgi:hypothetical protein
MSEVKCPKCGSDAKFLYSLDDWFDGDEDDCYECTNPKCKHYFKIYIPR